MKEQSCVDTFQCCLPAEALQYENNCCSGKMRIDTCSFLLSISITCFTFEKNSLVPDASHADDVVIAWHLGSHFS